MYVPDFVEGKGGGTVNVLKRTIFAALLSAGLLMTGASALDLGVGTVNGNGLRLRESPDTSSAVLNTAASGDIVLVREELPDGWYRVSFDRTEGYMASQYVTLSVQSDCSLGYGQVTAEGGSLNVRSGPGTGFDRLGALPDGTVVRLVGMDSGWFSIEADSLTGYVSSDYITLCDAPASTTDSISTAATIPANTDPNEPLLPPEAGSTPAPEVSAVPTSELSWQIPIVAEWFLGVPYAWGGSSPEGFDCSGFTHYVFGLFGRELNRTASGQLENGVAVSREELQPGDLVFFDNGQVSTPVSHVGIYTGDGQFIHASTNTYQVQYDSLNSNYYDRTYVYARRIF